MERWLIVKAGEIKGNAFKRWVRFLWDGFLSSVKDVYRVRVAYRVNIYAIRLEGDQKDIEIAINYIKKHAKVLLEASDIQLDPMWERL